MRSCDILEMLTEVGKTAGLDKGRVRSPLSLYSRYCQIRHPGRDTFVLKMSAQLLRGDAPVAKTEEDFDAFWVQIVAYRTYPIMGKSRYQEIYSGRLDTHRGSDLNGARNIIQEIVASAQAKITARLAAA